jgi:hypothetical protein
MEMVMRKKAFLWSVGMGVVVAGLALATPGAAGAAVSGVPARPASSATVPGRLYGVTAISASDAWAVGLQPGGGLIMHWNGHAWSSYPSPGFLTGAAHSSANNVWAVGGTNWFSPTQPLAERWNGSSWAQVRTPNPKGGGYFNAVTATSAGNAWAVGLAAPGGPGVPSQAVPLIEHWDGKHWTIQKIQLPAGGGFFTAVAATSSSDAWAVGSTGPASEGTGQRTLIEHWNGRTWSLVPSPNVPGSSANFLKGIAAVSSHSAWAVGGSPVGGPFKTMVLYWDGAHWTLVPSPTPAGDAILSAVTATWTHNIWAVGLTHLSHYLCGPNCQTLVEHWNSKKWKVLPSPNPPSDYLNALQGVSGASRNDIWAVGTTDFANTLILHWNGRTWSVA